MNDHNGIYIYTGVEAFTLVIHERKSDTEIVLIHLLIYNMFLNFYFDFVDFLDRNNRQLIAQITLKNGSIQVQSCTEFNQSCHVKI